MEVERENKRGKGKEEEEMMSWDLIPQHIIDKLLSFFPLRSVIRFRRVCREWNNLLHTWEFLRPLIVRENSIQVMNYCLLNGVVPLPEGVESLKGEDGSAMHGLFPWKGSYILTMRTGDWTVPVGTILIGRPLDDLVIRNKDAEVSMQFCMWQFVIDGSWPCWKKIGNETLRPFLWGKETDYEYLIVHTPGVRGVSTITDIE